MAINKDKFSSLLKKNPLGVACAVLCLGLGVAGYIRMDMIPEMDTQLETNTAMVDRLTLNLNYSTHLQAQYDELIDSAKRMEPRIVKLSALADNQRYFYKIEASTGAKLIDLRQNTNTLTNEKDAKKGTGYYQPISFTVVIQGDFAKSLAFLRELEAGQHFSRITSVTVSPAAAVQSENPQADVPGSLLTTSINLDLLGTP